MRSKNSLDQVTPTSGRRFVAPTYLLVLFDKSLAHFQAALCALRVIKKDPDLTDHFVVKAKNLLADRNHGVLLTAITLVIEMVQADPSCLDEFRNVRKPCSVLNAC